MQRSSRRGRPRRHRISRDRPPRNRPRPPQSSRLLASSSPDINHYYKFSSLDEFLQLLSLFFASSVNIKSRLVSVLKNESLKHANIGNLNAEEAKQYENFLYNFYGLNNEQNSSFTDDLSYTKIAELFSQKVSSFLFVKL